MTHSRRALMAAFVTATLLVLPAGPAPAQSPAGESMPPASSSHSVSQITVSGTGRFAVAPDMAQITLGVQVLLPTAAEAMQANSSQLAAVLERLKAEGIAPRDLQTSGLSLSANYHYTEGRAERVLNGYQAANTLSVRVRDLSRIGQLLDQLISDGANELQGIRFGLQDSVAAQDAARDAAIRDARRRAEALARAEGLVLGRVLEITEGREYSQEPVMAAARMMAAEAKAVPIEGGEIDFSAEVRVRWELVSP